MATFTGKKRYRVVELGLFRKKQVLVLQYEMTGRKTDFICGVITHYDDVWWVDAKPEWELQNVS